MADLSADADASANLDSSCSGSPVARLSTWVGQLRAWQEQQRDKLLRQQEQSQLAFDKKQVRLNIDAKFA